MPVPPLGRHAAIACLVSSAVLDAVPLATASPPSPQPSPPVSSASPPPAESSPPATEPSPPPAEPSPDAARSPDLEDAPMRGATEVILVEAEAPPDSASSVHLGERRLRAQPRSRPSDLLRHVPGLVVSQHAGGGKSDQYFLRGFDADHGTDVAIFVDGIPVNLTSHGHGQGYADLQWLIPETIASVEVRKGPYSARHGDFYTAGAIELTTIEPPPGAEARVVVGAPALGPVAWRRPASRVVGVVAPRVRAGAAVLAAEVGYTDGPFLSPQRFGHLHVFGKVRRRVGASEVRGAVTGYGATWDQSGQLPAAEVEAGRLDRFGSLDPSEGGGAMRGAASLGWSRGNAETGAWDASAFLVRNRFQLFSNFTLFARDPTRGDQIEQNDERTLAGGTLTFRRAHRHRAVSGSLSLGLQVRADLAVVDLWHTEARRRLDTCWEVANPCNRARNGVLAVGAYVEEDLSVGARLRLVGGLRIDGMAWRVEDLDPETAGTGESLGGAAQAALVSPKLSAVVAATDGLAVFASLGTGFHSNDARAAVAARGSGALARAIGGEVGARVAPAPEVRFALAAWHLRLASEQVWSGDLGGTEPSDPSVRHGLDLEIGWEPTAWLAVDAHLAVARARLLPEDGSRPDVPLAPRVLGGGGLTVRGDTTLAAVRVRALGDRPASDDGSLVAEGFALVDVVVQHVLGATTIGVTIENLLDAPWREAQFAEESRVAPTAAVRPDVHFTPGAPLTASLVLARRW
jgi:outer membrane receptor protein involved in Fe transport